MPRNDEAERRYRQKLSYHRSQASFALAAIEIALRQLEQQPPNLDKLRHHLQEAKTQTQALALEIADPHIGM